MMRIYASQLASSEALNDITNHLMHTLNIDNSRCLLILLNDFDSENNKEAIKRWIKPKIWQSLNLNGYVCINELTKLLNDHLSNSFNEANFSF
tara:strand:+ start:2130 stop:2408 length:279 start_codon:yes stop_codon:yes gene_type:complete